MFPRKTVVGFPAAKLLYYILIDNTSDYTFFPKKYLFLPKVHFYYTFSRYICIMKVMTVSKIKALSRKPVVSVQGDDFCIIDRMLYDDRSTRLSFPCRVDGLVCLYCMDGALSISVGMENYCVEKDCFIICLPGDIVEMKFLHENHMVKVSVMALSNRLLSEMEFDLPKSRMVFMNRMVRTNLRYRTMIGHFRNLFRSVITTPHEDSIKSMSYILRSMNIEIANLWTTLVHTPARNEIRSSVLVDQFVNLVAMHHMQHRDVAFYASQLSLSVKYLSTTVKSVSGRSATQWIIFYVILEAKYYLKHSNLTIKSIAYDLHFRNQMDFYRYFLRHTGITPTQYRRQPITENIPDTNLSSWHIQSQ